jgi:hypothetical protein
VACCRRSAFPAGAADLLLELSCHRSRTGLCPTCATAELRDRLWACLGFQVYAGCSAIISPVGVGRGSLGVPTVAVTLDSAKRALLKGPDRLKAT